ncbi:hypothetical protein BG006_005394 [Podila minutissima]|uniref:Uncharacterized protein n=1 Tax=Podila minutissima TaxID=64525 RepID=A0A9P5SJX7_9FUNG|nr:hypothetical protein BG006_005394 [Podila minutissima]
MKRAFKSFFGLKKKPDQANLALRDPHDQRSRDTPPPFNTRAIYSQQDVRPIPISRSNTRPLSYPHTSTNTNTNTDPRSLEDIKVYEERLQDLESRIAEVTEQLSHKIRLHNKALEHDRSDDEDELLQSPIPHDDKVLPRRRKDGKSREQASCSTGQIPHSSSSRQGPRVPQKPAYRRSAHSAAIDIPRHRESFVYEETDSFFDPEDYDSSHTTNTHHLSPSSQRYSHDEQVKHDKDKQSKTTRKPVKRNANSYISYDNNASSSKNHARQRGHPSSSDIGKAVNDDYLPNDQMHSHTTNTEPISSKAISAPWQPQVVSPSQAVVTAVSSTGSLFADHTTSPPQPSKSRLSMMFGDRQDSRRPSLPWTPQDHTSHTPGNDSSDSMEEMATSPAKTPISSRRTSVDLDHSAAGNTMVFSTQIKSARHQPLFHEGHSTHSVHAKIELSKLEEDDIQKAHRVIHPYRATGLDTSQIHQSSMIMEPRPTLSSRDPDALPSSPRTSFVAPGSPPQRLRSPIAMAASPRSNYLLSTSPISTVSSEQGTRRFSSATSRGTARRIIYSAELEHGLPKGHIARESNYEVVGEAIVQMTSSIFAERIRSRIHAFLFQDSPRRMNHRKRLPSAHHYHQGHEGVESVQVSEIETSIESRQEPEIENSMCEVSSDAFTEEEEEEEEEENEEEGSIRSRRMSAPPRLGLLSSSPSPSFRAQCEFLQPVRPRSLYSVLRRISPSRYVQEALDMSFMTDAPLHTRCISSYNTALVGGMFPMEMEQNEEEEQEQEEETEEPASGPCPDPSHMERPLHEENDENTENCGSSLAQDPSSSSQVRPVLINGLTCEELLHSIRFESDREGSPGYYGPAEYQRDEEVRWQREEEGRAQQEALNKMKMKQGQETRKRNVGEASFEIVAKVGGALTLAASTAWHTTALLATRIPTAVTTRTHAAGSRTMAITTSSSVAEEQEGPKEASI